MTTALRMVQRQLDAYNARDIDAFAACFTEDVQLHELHDSSVIAEGRQALRTLYQDLFERCPKLHAMLLNRIENGDVVVDHERVSGMGEEDQEAVAIYRVRDGLIQQVWFS
jgi:hypothetical protein